MITRAKSGIIKSKYIFVGFLHTESPSTLAHASEPHSVFTALAQNEYEALCRNQTWVLVPYWGQKLVDSKWVFKTKFKVDGSF